MRCNFALLALPLLLACPGSNISTSNNLPELVIQEPVDGSVHSASEGVLLRGRAMDSGAGGGIVEIAWTSDLSGVLFEGPPDDDDGNTLFTWTEAEAGVHVLTLRAIDTGGASVQESISITVVDNQAPTCTITSPTGVQILDSTEPVLLQAQVGDDSTPASELSLRWESDIDGLLDSTPADALGVASAAVQVSPAEHRLSLSVTDSEGLSCEDSVDLTMNGPPSAPGLSFEPNPPNITEDLRVVLSSPSVDPEGEPVEYLFRWFLNDEPFMLSEDEAQDVVPSDALQRDQVWLVESHAIDSFGLNSEVTQLSTLVPDAMPGAPGVEVQPSEPSQAQDLTCSVETESVDPDPGDLVSYSFSWKRNGNPTGLTGTVLAWEETEVGEDWTCEVTPTDGTLIGTPGEATVTIVQGCFALDCNGSFGQVLVPDDPALRLDSGDFTIEAWLRADSLASTGSDKAVVSKRESGSDNGWHLGVDDAGLPFFHVSIGANPRLDATSGLSVGSWSHVALVYDSGSGQASFFVDGALAGSGALPSPSAAATADLLIGEDGAGLSGRVWDGLVDDVRISSTARYGIPFIPDTSLDVDGDTVALWGFEEGTGTDIADLSGSGLDGFLLGAAFGSESACDLDLAPTAPGLSVSPDFPLAGEPLSCQLDVPSIDPEGLAVSYSGEWLLDGSPSGLTFTSFPAAQPSGGSEGELWTCQATASDGAQSSTAGSASVYVGSEPVCTLTVADPASAGSTVCGFEAPVEGLLRFTASNPDLSSDGHFLIDMGTLGTTWLFTGFKDWAYDGSVVLPWAEISAELNVEPSLGPVSLSLQYSPTGGAENTGTDSLIVDFVYYEQLDTGSATALVSSTVSSADSSNSSQVPSTVTETLSAGERLLLEAGPCGSAGLGSHGVYANDDGTVGNDGLGRVDTGEASTCLLPLRSLSLPPGTWDLTLILEDDFWSDNSGDRGLSLYRYTP